MIAVGVGVAPMIQTLRGIFKAMDRERAEGGSCADGQHGAMRESVVCSVKRIVLLYGVVRRMDATVIAILTF